MAANRIVVELSELDGDLVFDLADGGIVQTSTFKVISCDVDEEKGTLVYSNENLPVATPLPEGLRRGTWTHHVSKMRILDDIELQELEARGVEIVYQ